MLNILFPSAYELKNSKDKVTRLETHIENLEETIRTNRSYLERQVDDYTHRIEEGKRMSEVEKLTLKEEHEAKINNARDRARDEVKDEVENLRLAKSAAEATAEGYIGANQELRNNLDAHVTQVATLKAIIDTLVGKLPNVDLSKFNVNVDIAPAEVNVIGGKVEQKKA